MDFPPFAFVEGGTSAGVLVEAAERAFGIMGRELKWRPLPIGAFEDSLACGEIDIFVAVAVNEERRRRLILSDPLLKSGGAWFVSAGSSGDPADFRIIATPSSGPLSSVIARSYPGRAIVDAQDYHMALDQVLRGEADAAALNLHVGRSIAECAFAGAFDLPSETFVDFDLAIAIAPHDPLNLLAPLNRAITTLRAHGRLAI
jgi:ABC-type amino acid transport substrate-binding protein